MGDRGNIVVSDDGGTLHFYTHWSGSELPQIVANALDRGRSRWDDPPYLNRILFSELIQGDVLGETGYGISIQMGDGGTEVYIDHGSQTVTYGAQTWSFEDYVKAMKSAVA
jgi:hypothetical protein